MSAHRPSRPQSSASTHSLRPHSSASTRPISRLSQRPQSRHARANQARLLPLCDKLVRQILGENTLDSEDERDREDERRRQVVDHVVKSVESTTLNKAAVGLDMKGAERILRGHAQKARINSRDTLADALGTAFEQLKSHLTIEQDLDQDIKLSHLPDHLQLLLSLSNTPSPATVTHASIYLDNLRNPTPGPAPLTWQTILAEEPFEGEHWEGVYGLPPGSVKNQPAADDESLGSGSTPSLSPLTSDDESLDLNDTEDDGLMSSFPKADPVQALSESRSPGPLYAYAYRKELEDLQKRQYWRSEWRMEDPIPTRFDIGDASSLGPTLYKVLGRGMGGLPAELLQLQDRYIYEQDAVREILISLQGRKNIIFQWRDGFFTPTHTTPKLLHLSLASQLSILSSLSRTATTVQALRSFCTYIISYQLGPSGSRRTYHENTNIKPRITRTLEAFADAVDAEIQVFDAWCADREREGCRALGGMGASSVVVSLLSLEKSIKDTFEDVFGVLLDVIHQVLGRPTARTTEVQESSDGVKEEDLKSELFQWAIPRAAASSTTAHLLDTLFSSVQTHLERGERLAADAVMRVFVRAAEPVWGMVGRWLKDGMSVENDSSPGSGWGTHGSGELEEEFFIECNGLGIGIGGGMGGLLDPDFWKEGFTLRDGVGPSEAEAEDDFWDEGATGGGTRKRRGIPTFLRHIAEPVLSAGKSVGLLKVLGLMPSLHATGKGENGGGGVSWKWRSFAKLVIAETGQDEQSRGTGLFSISVDTLSRLIYDELATYCQDIGMRVSNALVDECELWRHMGTVEDLFLMRRGDIMSHFSDVLFAKMDSQQRWTDFHFLNTAFNDVVESSSNAGAKEWIQLPLVRLSHHGKSRDKGDRAIDRTVKAIDGLLVEYAVPFPLSYVFTPDTFKVYGDIFVFLMQIRRAKSVLDRILVRGDAGRMVGSELKVFCALRSRLSWFINTLLNFLTIYVKNVIHSQVSKFHEQLKEVSSLDEMIKLHDEHLGKIQGRCLLQTNTSALHRAILSILDMSLHFSSIFVAFAGDTTTTHDVSRHSVIPARARHRSRKQRRHRKNVIGFSNVQGLQDSEDDESEYENNEIGQGGDLPEPPSTSILTSTTTDEEGAFARIEKMSVELDGLVRFVRRGTESLAGGAGDAAPAFEVLAFALEDWDL